MHCGNLLAVAQYLRSRNPQREIVVAEDNEKFTHGNPGLTKATEAIKTIHAKLAVPDFPDTRTHPTDFNDLCQLEGIDTVKKQIDGATTAKESDGESFERLAKLPLADYDRCRETEAKRLGIR